MASWTRGPVRRQNLWTFSLLSFFFLSFLTTHTTDPFHSFNASKSVDRRFWTTCNSLILGFWASNMFSPALGVWSFRVAGSCWKIYRIPLPGEVRTYELFIYLPRSGEGTENERKMYLEIDLGDHSSLFIFISVGMGQVGSRVRMTFIELKWKG